MLWGRNVKVRCSMPGSWDIRIDGFGPFERQTTWHIPLADPHVAIYAGNGQGKTCLSRLFRAAEAGPGTLPESLVSKGCEQGRFLFAVTQGGRQSGTLAIDKAQAEEARVNNATGLLFHVFNADYVQENLAQRHYVPSGNIPGYLLGKESVELDAKRQRLEELGTAGKALRQRIEQAVEQMRGDLKALGISSRFKEFAELSVERIVALPPAASAYDERLRELTALKGLPDNAQVEMMLFTREQPDLDQMGELLTTSHTRDLFSKAFLNSANERRSFISQGLTLREGDSCPFCGQQLDDQAVALIHLYEEYLSGREALVVETLEAEAAALSRLKGSYSSFLQVYQQRRQHYDSLRAAFDELRGAQLPPLPTTWDFNATVDAVVATLNDKAADISSTYDISVVASLRDTLAGIDATVDEANQLIHDLNVALQKAAATLRETKRALCREAARRIRLTCDDSITELVRLRHEYGRLRAEIRREESEGRTSKRDAVAELLERLLGELFAGKYRFDRESFSVVFRETALGDQTEQVLSDGEKMALAFCHFVASSMELLTHERDRERLCLVIDDPTTDLDDLHAHCVADVIGRLEELLGLPQLQLLVLTHDAALFEAVRTGGTGVSTGVLENGMLHMLGA